LGEISEALRRARLEREARSEAPRAASEAPALEKPAGPPRPRAPIDRARSGSWPARAVLVEGQRVVAERFRQLAVRVEQELSARDRKTLLVSSAHRGEGKTLTSCNLALALASLEADRRVALVDLDLRKPSVARVLGIDAGRGLEHVLRDGLPAAEACVATEIASLDVYPVRRPDRDAHALLSTPAFERMLRDLQSRYSTVIFDMPPILAVPDVALIASRIGACLIVARAGSTRRKALLDALRPLPEDALIGVFLNEAHPRRGERRYAQDYYGAEGDAEPQYDRPEEWHGG
jgi:capsular exopolysaccharide synthesis family protein